MNLLSVKQIGRQNSLVQRFLLDLSYIMEFRILVHGTLHITCRLRIYTKKDGTSGNLYRSALSGFKDFWKQIMSPSSSCEHKRVNVRKHLGNKYDVKLKQPDIRYYLARSKQKPVINVFTHHIGIELNFLKLMKGKIKNISSGKNSKIMKQKNVYTA